MTGVLPIVACLPRKRVIQVRPTVASRNKNRNGKRRVRLKMFFLDLATGAICLAAQLCGYMDSRMPTQPHRTLMLSGPAGRMETILWATSEEGKGARPPLAAVV